MNRQLLRLGCTHPLLYRACFAVTGVLTTLAGPDQFFTSEGLSNQPTLNNLLLLLLNNLRHLRDNLPLALDHLYKLIAAIPVVFFIGLSQDFLNVDIVALVVLVGEVGNLEVAGAWVRRHHLLRQGAGVGWQW